MQAGKFKIRTRILVLSLLLALLPLLVSTLFTSYDSWQSLREQALKSLDAVASAKATRIETYLEGVRQGTETLAELPTIAESMGALNSAVDDDDGASERYGNAVNRVRPLLLKHSHSFGFLDLMLVNDDAVVVYCQSDNSFLTRSLVDPTIQNTPLGRAYEQARVLLHVENSQFYLDSKYEAPVMYLAAPVVRDRKVIGVLVVLEDGENFTRVVNDPTGLGSTGETLVGVRAQKDVVLVAPPRLHPDLWFSLRVPLGGSGMVPLQAATYGGSGAAEMVDYRHADTMAAWRYLPSFDGGLVVKMDKSEALAPVYRQRQMFMVFLGLTVACVLIAAFFVARSLARPIDILTSAVKEMGQGRALEEIELPPPTSSTEINVLTQSFADMVRQVRSSIDALEESNLTLEHRVAQRTAELETAGKEIRRLMGRLELENARMSSELKASQRLQQMMLPRGDELNLVPELDVAAFMEPATEVGGDYYDVVRQNGHVVFGIGDVTGHGLESGVMSIMVQTAVRTLLASELTEPQKFFQVLNRVIYDNVQRMKSNRNLTLSTVKYKDHVATISGQHEEVILVRRDGALDRLDTIDLGFPLGLESDITKFVAERRVVLEAGDVIVLYTDGITEAEGTLGNRYGVEQLCGVANANRAKPAAAILSAVVADWRRHAGDGEVRDDISLLVIKQK